MKSILPITILFLCSCKGLVAKQNESSKEQVAIYKADILMLDKSNIDSSSMEVAARNVLRLYDSKNGKALDKMIHPDIGIYYMFSVGASNEWEKAYSTCIIDSCHSSGIPSWLKEQLRKQKILTTGRLQIVRKPVITDCDNFISEGLFYEDTPTGRHLLSSIMKEHIQNVEQNESHYSKGYLTKLKESLVKVNSWEQNTKRIVLAHKDGSFYGGSFIFYLTQIKNIWYLTAIDFASLDCSV